MREFLSIAKALSDESRVRALLSIKNGELCLCQIIDVLGLSPATVSRHMNVLHQAGLVQRRKDGKWHYYSLVSEAENSSARRALDWTLQELRNDPAIREDSCRIRVVRRQNLEELSLCYRS
jgi:DNA-binding transcriptional ArsR family regulator